MSTDASNEQLRELVDRAARPTSADTERTASTPMVAFRAAGRWFAVSAHAVREVVTLGSITAVPGAIPQVLGVALVRGRLVPAIDLFSVLGLERGDEHSSARQRLIVLARGDDEVCVIADETRGVLDLPVVASGGAQGPVRGELRWNGALVAVLEPEVLVANLASPERAR